jgi:hypothetical protein
MELTDGPVLHRVDVATAAELFGGVLGFSPLDGVSLTQWLATPTQRLAEATAGAVFHDGLGVLARCARNWPGARTTCGSTWAPSADCTRSNWSTSPPSARTCTSTSRTRCRPRRPGRRQDCAAAVPLRLEHPLRRRGRGT